MIPLFVDCSGRRVVIFGGGAVAARKAAYFADEARVLVVSRSFVQKIETLPVDEKECGYCRLHPMTKLPSLIGNAFLVIGALSDPAQNNRIGKLCKKNGILFNNADGDRRRRDPAGESAAGRTSPLRSARAAAARRSPGSSGNTLNRNCRNWTP